MYNSLYDELSYLETIITLTKEICLNKEFRSEYYELPDSCKKYLSKERNHYINMLSIALEKISKLMSIEEHRQ